MKTNKSDKKEEDLKDVLNNSAGDKQVNNLISDLSEVVYKDVPELCNTTDGKETAKILAEFLSYCLGAFSDAFIKTVNLFNKK